jgi:Ni/Co efflux regulator RcnB
MRKIVLALAAVSALGLSLSVAAPANAQEGKIVIRTGDRDRHHERHWDRYRHEGRYERRQYNKVIVIKRRHHRDHD